MNKPKIFATAKGSHEYTSALPYGELVFLYTEKANVFASDQLVKDLEKKLEGSTPDDFLILSGSMLPASLAFHILMEKHGHVHNLIYSFKNFNYELRTIRRTQFAIAQEE